MVYENLTTVIAANYVPVGTVEYVQRYAVLSDIELPENITYPQQLQKYLHRTIGKNTFKNVSGDQFVKPVNTKVFTGGIKSQLLEPVDADCAVWESSPVAFESEFRYYVVSNTIVGFSQYDDLDNAGPDIQVVQSMVNDYTESPIGYAIDVGVVNGESVLIEVNDGWALGLYPWGTMTDARYVELITRRWQEILQKN